MKRREFIKKTSAAGLLTIVGPSGIVQTFGRHAPEDSLETLFKSPPETARPHTWYHWMNGNVTKQGITLDLEAMKRIGLGGFQNFDAGTGIPKGPIEYLSPEWLELKRHTITEAKRLGLEFTMHNCPGWSSSGGPWITPALTMQQVTWSELFVAGGKEVVTALPKPLTKLDYYQDIAVLAYPSLPGEQSLTNTLKKASNGIGVIDLKIISDPSKSTEIAGKAGDKNYLLLEFREAQEVQSVSFITKATGSPPAQGPTNIVLEVSDDNVTFKPVGPLTAPGNFGALNQGEAFVASDFDAVKGKFFRLVSTQTRSISQLRLTNTRRPVDWLKRGNFAYSGKSVKPIPSTSAIPSSSIVDITDKIDASGALKWNAPKGNWTIVRVGFTPIGTYNRSAPDTGVGLECDKYSKEAFRFHFNKMMEQLLPELKVMGEDGKAGLLIDSYEVGMQNWTLGFEKEFAARAGYNIGKYLLAVVGKVIDSPETTDRFLWDLRRVQADMMADNYYGEFTALCHQHKMIAYIQPYDRGPMDELQIGSRIDINVGEFWNGLSAIFQNNLTMRRTTRLSASIAHTNGQKVVAAESFTGEPESARWMEYPFGMKALGDRKFTEGLNRVVFHRFAHQPHPTAVPGMTMGPWGIHFDRTNTWFEQGRAWMDYLTRCQYLLQEGTFVADIAYFNGEDPGIYAKVERNELQPSPPNGFDYDIIHYEVLLSKSKVVNKRLVVDAGTSYAALVLQDSAVMSLKLLQKIHGFVRAGLTVAGPKPVTTPGLRPAEMKEFEILVSQLWGGGDVGVTKYGEGTVLWGGTSKDIVDVAGLRPDFEYTSVSGDAPLRYIHRRTADAEYYFLCNQRRTFESVRCSFRVTGKQPEMWDPITGKTSKAATFTLADTTQISMSFAPLQSVFVVFRSAAPSKYVTEVKPLTPMVAPRIEVDIEDSKNVVDTFTISLLVKPETNVMLSTNNFMDGQLPWTDNYAIHPVAGEKLYGAGHATCGLAIGINGVTVWHNSTGVPQMLFAAPSKISGWSYVVVKYEQGKPSVYVNGVKTYEHSQGFKNVHPGVGRNYVNEGGTYYNGDLVIMRSTGRALDETQIKRDTTEVPFSKSALFDMQRPDIGRDNEYLFWRDNTYAVKDSDGSTRRVEVKGALQPMQLAPWKLAFPANAGAPSEISMPKLISLKDSSEPGVKYFSGTCSYECSFELNGKDLSKDRRLFLNLGEVEVIAEVILNGKNLGVLWSRPYQMEVTDAVKAGANTLVVKVTNQWPNRLIGDEQLPEENEYVPGAGGSGFGALRGGAIVKLPEWYMKGEPKPAGRVTFATWKHYTKDSPLFEAGLIGPVSLVWAVAKNL